ncbi:hypothetical protein AJ88_28145 [Mesorhizobium amorphae CCBAU 01583]|nr:hypothetical protein AJ88_28145 [Mesorhizobium amorphae CCBAU 01583]
MGILFFKLHQILELIALCCLPGSLLPLIVGLFRYSSFLDRVLMLSPRPICFSISPSFWPRSFSE